MAIERAGLQKNEVSVYTPSINSSVDEFYKILESSEFFEYPSLNYSSHSQCNFQSAWKS